MTMGELARLFNGERKIGADLTVVAMKGWRRDEWFDDTSLPSRSILRRTCGRCTPQRSIREFVLESTNLSVGRGTETPFEHVGAPWIDGPRLSDALNGRQNSGRALLSRSLHPDGQQVRQSGMPGRVHGDHGPYSWFARYVWVSRSRRP